MQLITIKIDIFFSIFLTNILQYILQSTNINYFHFSSRTSPKEFTLSISPRKLKVADIFYKKTQISVTRLNKVSSIIQLCLTRLNMVTLDREQRWRQLNDEIFIKFDSIEIEVSRLNMNFEWFAVLWIYDKSSVYFTVKLRKETFLRIFMKKIH